MKTFIMRIRLTQLNMSSYRKNRKNMGMSDNFFMFTFMADSLGSVYAFAVNVKSWA